MSITTVAELRTALGIGTLYTDAVLQSVCDAADDVMLPFLWKNTTPVSGHSNNGTAGILYFQDYVQDVFYVGQTITVTGCGSNFNGTKTVNGVGEKTINITTTHAANVVKTFHPINPYRSSSSYNLHRLHNHPCHSGSQPYDQRGNLASTTSTYRTRRIY
jgi:hypothetical protein